MVPELGPGADTDLEPTAREGREVDGVEGWGCGAALGGAMRPGAEAMLRMGLHTDDEEEASHHHHSDERHECMSSRSHCCVCVCVCLEVFACLLQRSRNMYMYLYVCVCV